MKPVIILFLVLTVLSLSSANYSCGTCNGSWLLNPDGQECTSVVKTKCSGLSGRPTTAWRRGTNVWNNCNLIPSQTAIATFAGPGGTYNGGAFRHAAIFIGCDPNGIRVYDQWANRNPPGCSERLIRTTGTGSNGALNFYTILL